MWRRLFSPRVFPVTGCCAGPFGKASRSIVLNRRPRQHAYSLHIFQLRGDFAGYPLSHQVFMVFSLIGHGRCEVEAE